MDQIVNRFLKYVSFDTQSDEASSSTPSTLKQFKLAEYLVEELNQIGMQEVEMDSMGYVYATLPANVDYDVPTIGFIAHMDTSPDASGAEVRPRIIENYDGTDIVLDAAAGIVSAVEKFPELRHHVGEELIVTDGHTLLGADDKAGIAEIVTAMAYLLAHPEVKHGRVRVAFNPDEEIGRGAHHFDVKRFGCEWAYTMDGGEMGELEFENFNAASARVEITGVSVHPGFAKDKMVNAARLATELVQKMPAAEVPEETTDYEGFFHLTGISGTVERATVNFIIRDHDRERFEARKAMLRGLVQGMNLKYGYEALALQLDDTYYNMRRHRRGTTFLHGAALPQHLRGRTLFPRPARTASRAQPEKGLRSGDQHCASHGRTLPLTCTLSPLVLACTRLFRPLSAGALFFAASVSPTLGLR